jgi:hypothetical protein
LTEGKPDKGPAPGLHHGKWKEKVKAPPPFEIVLDESSIRWHAPPYLGGMNNKSTGLLVISLG